MNPIHISIRNILASMAIAATLWSCVQPIENTNNNKDKNKDKNQLTLFEKAFKEMVNSDKYTSCSWIFAQSYEVYVDPRPVSAVNVYVRGTDSKYYLTAEYNAVDQPATLNFDGPMDLESVLVRIGDKYFVVEPGASVAYTDVGDMTSPPAIADEPLSWIVAIENNYDAEKESKYGEKDVDMDFNDLVLKLSAVRTDTKTKIKITPKACGDFQMFYLHFFDGDNDMLLWPDDATEINDMEFHQWFGITDYMTRVNTGPYYDENELEVIYNKKGGWASQTAVQSRIKPCTFAVSNEWGIPNISSLMKDYEKKTIGYRGLYVTVGSFKAGSYFLDSKPDCIIASELIGTAPHMLIFPNFGGNGEWRWPSETNMLGEVYGAFNQYVANPSAHAYRHWHEFPPDLDMLIY